ncbi:MAG: exodeoxyribonuclease VII large subunit [Motiliproteus sp.]|nr:exodeoxyribonuclease VII large subunit [Motiliproteus sp.]MCW9050774.1 exodeoxyribonuclease VII large subunit [Motiliproteus sp.]
MVENANPIVSVSELNHQARMLLERGFSMITVEGEISNFVCPSSGHWYFSLKDNQAQVRCALFRNRNRFLKYRPKNGDQVRLRAKVSLYEGRGEFQLIGDYLEEAGAGALQAAYEALKSKLQIEGLFDPDYKQPLPDVAKHIGVITSPTGAAVRDIISVLNRRFPSLPVSLYPAAVQGEEAPQQLIKALQFANRDGRCDVLILGRGGGSLEDLWAFNNETLARAIHASDIPVVSAVGHEVDFSIADFVADVRAPTPSAAAELVSPDREYLLGRFGYYEEILEKQLQRRLQLNQLQLDNLGKRLRHPGQQLQDKAQKLDGLELRLNRILDQRLEASQAKLENLQRRLSGQSPGVAISQLEQSTTQLGQRLQRAMAQSLERKKLQLAGQTHGLQAVSPLATLDRGYAIVTDSEGSVLTDSGQQQPGQQIQARLAKGRLQCEIIAVSPETEHKEQTS